MAKILFLLFTGPDVSCKLQHAFLFARDAVSKGSEAQIVFEGDAPRWVPVLRDKDHSLRGQYIQAKQKGLIGGVCRGCAMMHNVLDDVEAEGLPILDEAFGHVSVASFVEKGYHIVSL